MVIDQPWKVGAKLELTLPMTPRVVVGDPKVAAQIDRVAIQRGPLVCCVEQADNPGIDLDKIILPRRPEFVVRLTRDSLGDLMRLSVGARQVGSNGDEEDVQVNFIPYYAWANRDPGRMMVWITGEKCCL